jgi:cytochrome c1
MLLAVSTMPPSKKLTNTFHTPPTIGLNSSMSIAVKKKLKFSPQSNKSAKKQAFLLNFCNRDEVKIECPKYLKHAAGLPINQENQLTFLLNQFQVRDIQASFYKLIGEVGGVASSAFTPMS